MRLPPVIATVSAAVLASFSVLTAPVLLAGAAEAGPARAETCLGEPATIVGEGRTVRGTPGPDVMVVTVTRFRTGVRGYEGDDLICLVGGSTRPARVRILGNRGDDRVLVRVEGLDQADVDLGAGNDRYTDSGAEAVDIVETGPGDDEVSTGGGDDQVSSGGSGWTSRDRIDLGRGSDTVSLEGDTSGTSLRGGEGIDELHLVDPFGAGAYAIDNRAGTATRDGLPLASWDGMERFRLLYGSGPVSFRGGPADEHLSLPKPNLLDVEMGGGRDTVSVIDTPDGSVIDGGAGDDRVTVIAVSGVDVGVTVSLAAELLQFRNLDPQPGSYPGGTAVLRDFENAQASAEEVRVTGDGGRNLLEAYGCRAVARAGAGADVVYVIARGIYHCKDAGYASARAYGEEGNDRLVGAARDGIRRYDAAGFVQVLVGGPGRDVADGRAGARDRCSAERELRCELNP